MKITKPVEELRGNNRGIVRIKIGNMHCLTPTTEVIRTVRDSICNWAIVPKPLRRGFILCCLEKLKEDRDLFNYVSKGA